MHESIETTSDCTLLGTGKPTWRRWPGERAKPWEAGINGWPGVGHSQERGEDWKFTVHLGGCRLPVWLDGGH